MYTKSKIFSFFLNSLGGIKVDRNAHDFSFVEKSCKILEKGGVVEIYPEARLPKEGEERPLPFKPSAVYLALESGAPIIPVYNSGKYFSRERVRVVIGKPINVQEMYREELSYKENIEAINEYLRGKIIELGKEYIGKEAEG
jgi:1-acyl-sn-glycerol-3-phosphate acyltransferase